MKKTFCAQHYACHNDDCYRKPTKDDLIEMNKDYRGVVWCDYHVRGVKTCLLYKGETDAK